MSAINAISITIVLIHCLPSQQQRGWSSCLQIIIPPTQECSHRCWYVATVATPQSVPSWLTSMCCHFIHHHLHPNFPCSWLLTCCPHRHCRCPSHCLGFATDGECIQKWTIPPVVMNNKRKTIKWVFFD
jgi:hypothetical protein